MRRLDRIGAFGGLLYASFGALGWLLWKALSGWGTVETNATAAEVARFYTENQGNVRAALIPWTLGIFGLVVFIGRLHAEFREREGGSGTLSSIFFAGGLMGATAFPVIAVTFFWAMVFRPASTSPEVVQILHDLALITGPAGGMAWCAMFVAAGVAIREFGGLPRWLGTLAIVVGLAQILYIGAGFSDRGLFDGGDGLLGVYVPYGTHFLWITLASVALLRRAKGKDSA